MRARFKCISAWSCPDDLYGRMEAGIKGCISGRRPFPDFSSFWVWNFFLLKWESVRSFKPLFFLCADPKSMYTTCSGDAFCARFLFNASPEFFNHRLIFFLMDSQLPVNTPNLNSWPQIYWFLSVPNVGRRSTCPGHHCPGCRCIRWTAGTFCPQKPHHRPDVPGEVPAGPVGAGARAHHPDDPLQHRPPPQGGPMHAWQPKTVGTRGGGPISKTWGIQGWGWGHDFGWKLGHYLGLRRGLTLVPNFVNLGREDIFVHKFWPKL